MNQTTTWDKVDQYITERLIPQDAVLEEVLVTNQQAGLPPFDVSPSQGKFLNLLVQMKGARRILEIGTLGGYSTIWMARALPSDGQIVTLELDPIHAQVAKANLSLAEVDHLVELRVGDALEQLSQMKQEGVEPFDFIFIDADKPNNPNYLKWALQFSQPGTVILGDNVIREGEVINENSEDARVVGVREFYDLLAEESRISATAIQTVGSKGYDGFVLGIVNS
ncbi:methyltransferase [Paenibacillus odorifer]|uniref:O-methyltransferase n=1 Tax=Paenibacillus TaxID=44249 RepID=UPI00096F932F|nr:MULTISPECIES: O-methyltransferase [Paenibacillus]MDH6429360.1 putative O-methyltransferase YrrM [Paenibacillus sp. PastH-4]MDH6445567.1 putative O-methyltransferase YrrM [Paenibacillus sp. PastF-4]MDH6529455.1 putative O-methyltransferase YrrM [Paenibacillus sp. PastH-3]OMD65410.1 methyltransferase [Paenibacillus odorifer]